MLNVSKFGIRPDKTLGRVYETENDKFRNNYQRDVGRIIHSTAFRRLKYKTQVFVNHEGDHFRTRLTHTLEVSQIARSISRYFKLNEDLTEAIALAHDLGHTPFGHAGEDALVKASGSYFNHNDQSFRIVTFLEKAYSTFDGLNLTWETLEGLAKHNGPLKNINKKSTIFLFNESSMDLDLKIFPSLEAQIASISDDIAYMNHDLDDGFRAGLFSLKDLTKLSFYKEFIKKYGLEPNSSRFKKELVRNLINKMVVDLIVQTEKNLQKIKPKNVNHIRNAGFNIASFSTKMKKNISEIRFFLNKKMYNHKTVSDKTKKYKKIIEILYQQYSANKVDIPSKWINETYGRIPTDYETNKKQMIIDYISGMTDRYILKIYNRK
ncbi:MAG: deoxyguanosinetriphosphate triphosphohydrolase [Alphaproteobacteria bacterium]|nr:deoxyguanosinetriphosphate triphosphohydrolase [Alphaproteobacteria bacterium]